MAAHCRTAAFMRAGNEEINPPATWLQPLSKEDIGDRHLEYARRSPKLQRRQFGRCANTWTGLVCSTVLKDTMPYGCQVVGRLRLRPLAVGVVLAAVEVAPAALVLREPIVVIVVVVWRDRDARQSPIRTKSLIRQCYASADTDTARPMTRVACPFGPAILGRCFDYALAQLPVMLS